MEESQNKLGVEPVGRLLFRLAVPAITAQLINALYNIVDRMYIGRMPENGSLALAALGVAFPLIMIISAFASLVGMGGAPRASIKMGEGNLEDAKKILNNSFLVLIGISVALTLIFYLGKEPMLVAFGATENTLPFANDYFSIYLMGTLFVQISLGLNQFISAQGFAKTSMFTVLIGAIINIVLDPIFIFGFGMGVRGAALATILSQFISAAWVLFFLFSKKSTLKINPKYFHLEARIILPVLALGVSPFVMQSTESLVQITLNSGLKTYGGAQADQLVGAMSILISTMQFVMMPLTGLTQGAQPIISYNYGAGKIDRVKQAFRILLISALAFSCTLWAISMFIPQAFVALFSDDPALLELGVYGMRIFMAGTLLMGAQCACQQTFVALGQAKISMFLALLRKIILLIPLAIILPHFLGWKGIFIAEPVADVLAVTTTVLTFAIYSRRLFAQPQVPERGSPELS
ncbi:MATE family efflux transporter [Clostridiaceae bacterium NSJ-31]|uniref:Multidrug export protein MepA n=1 Tax=Ligaoa zhengdingensis TaxID=2763658 RepID=A0A926DZD9_9FIRM|nr:MATE family efflux transporter [Ligaoa zhengdingensis]MBC8546000.1 MATE family efflux transporter [Ligaoa zhengdingensis]